LRPIVSANPRNLLIRRLERSRPAPTAIRRLDENFFRVRFDRLTPGEKRSLRSMASLGPGPAQSGDIADTLRLTAKSLGPARSKLIKKKGMIYSRPLWRSGVHCASVRRVYASCHANLVNGDCQRPIGWKGSGVALEQKQSPNGRSFFRFDHGRCAKLACMAVLWSDAALNPPRFLQAS
jgi:hypothetical protein